MSSTKLSYLYLHLYTVTVNENEGCSKGENKKKIQRIMYQLRIRSINFHYDI